MRRHPAAKTGGVVFAGQRMRPVKPIEAWYRAGCALDSRQKSDLRLSNRHSHECSRQHRASPTNRGKARGGVLMHGRNDPPAAILCLTISSA